MAHRWKLISENLFKQVAVLRNPDQRPVYTRKEDLGELLSTIEEPWFRDLVTFAFLMGKGEESY
jgi:hypothetical protein